jgi:hypothetical protein
MKAPAIGWGTIFLRIGRLTMKANELVVGGYYVREERSLILHFYSAGSDGLARYHGYNLKDGKFRHTGSCELGTMMQWADRKATTEEISRVKPREPVVEAFERHGSPLRRALRSTSGTRFDY